MKHEEVHAAENISGSPHHGLGKTFSNNFVPDNIFKKYDYLVLFEF